LRRIRRTSFTGERRGHASVAMTLDIYSYAIPAMRRRRLC
jgi:hypothetical protein